MDGTILLELELIQDSIKTISQRGSTQILDFLGDIGGFKEALLLVFVVVGEYFSARFFLDKVGQDLYVKKLNSSEIKHRDDV